MAKAFPGGASSARAFPPPLSGGASVEVAWTEEVVADFTSLATQQFDHDDTFSLGGVTWLVEAHDGSGTRGVVEAVSGSGIKITPAASGTNVYDKLNLPLVSTSLSDACPSISDQDLICVQLFFNEAVTPAANYDGHGAVIYKPAANGELDDVTEWLVYDNFFKDSGRKWKIGSRSTNGSETSNDGGSAPTTIEMIYSFWANYGTGAHSSSTDVAPAPFATNLHTGYCITYTSSLVALSGTFTEPTRKIDASTARCGYGAFKVSSGTSFHIFLKRIRILRAAGKAGGLA